MNENFPSDQSWYCLHVRPKAERLTAQLLRAEAGLEVFCPFIRFERARSTGRTWVREAMFPGYVFAQMNYATQHRQVQAIGGVTRIVNFGGHPAVVSTDIISELRLAVKDEETIEIPSTVGVGEEVNVVAGPFRGLRAVVTRLLPARERVAVLLEILGMEREVEVATGSILPDLLHPLTPRK